MSLARKCGIRTADFRAFAKTIGLNEIRNAIADGEIDAKTICAKFAHMGS